MGVRGERWSRCVDCSASKGRVEVIGDSPHKAGTDGASAIEVKGKEHPSNMKLNECSVEGGCEHQKGCVILGLLVWKSGVAIALNFPREIE